MELLLYIFIGLHVVPILLTATLKLISYPYFSVAKEIRRITDIDNETKEAAIHSMKTALKLDFKSFIYDVTAPVVLFYVFLFLKEEANELPKLFKKWDNNVSINGDGHWVIRGDQVIDLRDLGWENVNESDILVSYEELYPLGNAYYAKWFKPRSFMARWIFSGLRNRASWYAKELGPVIEERPVIISGQYAVNRDNPGYRLIKYKDWYHYTSLYKIGPLARIRNYGVKLENALKWYDGVVDKVPAAAIGISFKRWRN